MAKQNPFKNGWNCETCGNPTFYFINDGGCVGVLSCVKCGQTKDILIDNDWCMDMPETKKSWAAFNAYYHALLAFENEVP